MTEVPSYDDLRSLDRRYLNGLLHEYGDPAWAATYEHKWERDRATLTAVEAALSADPAGVVPHDSPPRWLEGIVTRELREMSESCWAHRFDLIRLLERLDLVAPEHDAIYTLAFLSGLGVPGPGRRREAGPGKVAMLAGDPELRDEMLWRLFEVEGGGEVSLTNMDRFFPADSWRATFLRLVDEGTVERERVIVSCLEALLRDFNHYRAAWFSATYNAFEPTLDELDRHQPHLRSLLLSSLPASVTFTVRHLKTLGRNGRLDAAVLPALASAVLVRTKGTALEVLRLAASFSDAERPLVLEVVSTALGHENADVQRAAATLLTKLGERETVETQAAGLAASVQKELGLSVRAVAESQARSQPLEQPAAEVSEADLLERTAALLEGGFTAAELEAVLAGLVLHGTPELLQPLHKRASAVVRRAGESDPRSLPGRIARMVLGGQEDELMAGAPVSVEQRLVLDRMAEVADAVAGLRPRRPLIATPDLPGWQLSREAFLSRATAGSPYPHDLVAALLRLRPDDRADVGAALPTVSGHPALQEPRHEELTGELRTFTWNDNGTERTGRYLHWDSDQRETTPSGDWLPVVAATRPHDAERFVALGIRSLLEAAHHPTVHHDIPVVLDTLARHPGQMGALAPLALALGLVAGRGDQRLHAADAFADLVPTGRVQAPDVAALLARYAEGWTLSRAADSLRHAAQGPGVGKTVVDLLTALVPRLSPSYRGLAALLDVLHEQSVLQGTPVTDPALRATLGQITGSSKAARTARALLG